MLTRRSALIVVGVLLLAGTAAWAAAKTAKPKPDPANDPYKLLCDAYLDGKWEDVEKTLAAKILPPSLRQHGAEVTAIRTTVTECRPGWWETCKANFGGKFSPVVWGQTLDATFAPGDKTSTQMNQANNNISFTITWPAGEMDNPAEAEHGFSRGDLMDLGIWGQLGTALSWKQVSPQSLGNLSPTDKLALMRYQDFRSNVTGLYYGTPKARRWGLFLYLLAWKNDYAKLPTVNARKANGAMFLAEVLTEPSKYPSLPLPKEEPAEKTEEKLAEQYRDWIENARLDLGRGQLAAGGDQEIRPGELRLGDHPHETNRDAEQQAQDLARPLGGREVPPGAMLGSRNSSKRRSLQTRRSRLSRAPGRRANRESHRCGSGGRRNCVAGNPHDRLGGRQAGEIEGRVQGGRQGRERSLPAHLQGLP